VPPYVVFHDATLRELARALPHDERAFLAVKGAGPSRWQKYGDRVVAITGAARPPLPPAEALPETAGLARERVDAPRAVRPAWREEIEPLPEPRTRREPLAAVRREAPPPRHESLPTPRRGLSGHEVPPSDAPPAWLDAVPPPEEGPDRAEPARGGDELWTLCSSGATLDEICARLRRTSAEVASQLADGARQGRSLDVQRLLGQDRVAAIRTAAAGAGGDLVAVRKRLPFPAALAEIRLALFAPGAP
jgi:HRDC domain/Helix-turn-helix domain